MIHQKISILLLIFFIPIFLFADEKDINISLDYGRFHYDSVSVYLEVYYTVFPPSTDIRESGELIKSSFDLQFALLNAENDSVLAEDTIPIHFDQLETLSGMEASGQMGILKLIIPGGKYRLRIISMADTVFEDIAVSPFATDKIAMSDLELCSNIITNFNDSSHPFYKNTMKVIPNPSGIYGKERPLLYYYLEIYNPHTEGIRTGSTFDVQTVIADPDGNIRMKRQYNRNQSLSSVVERGMFNISKLESGFYTLILAATDSVDDVSVYRRRNFYVHNPDVVVVSSESELEQQLNDEFLTQTEKQLDELFDQARYVATNSEKNVFKVLNSAESKSQFLARFWAARNKENPEWKDTYYKRVKEASNNFSKMGTPGWATDMGRVYILYGQPDETERKPFNPNQNPYEIWHYLDLEGGVEFDFVDISGFGIYELVNSTKRGEVTYVNWMEEYVQTQ
ncbi:MAG: GWxTD domain-containing protein [Calditrichaeota bacterium]|nr:GWxTD domain-containing protein [Calditrichota bacterium]